MKTSPFVLSFCLLASLLAACSDAPGSSSRYRATVTRTKYGVPHIEARDFGGLGYGYGYAFAEDNLCTMMEDFVAVRGERSKYFGPDGTYSIPAARATASNIDSDFFWKLIADASAVERFRSAAAPEARELGGGYVAGFNRYIRELQAGEHPGRHVACAGAPWLTPIGEDDVYRRFVRLAVLASSTALLTQIATTQPPGSPPLAAGAASRGAPPSADDDPLARIARPEIGSNMYALGPDATEDGTPIVFGNPHFPWQGTERLYLAHLTIPGTMDVEGASLYGAPLVLIGFNDHLAWSHTVSTARHFGLFQLSLHPDDPMRYYYGDELRDFEAVPLSIEVLGDDGTTTTRTRTLYRSQYGPMVSISVGGTPVLFWGEQTAFTLRDANLENDRLIDQYLRWNLAGSLEEFKRLHASILGVPWVNTVASGPGGDAYYGDLSVVPNVSDAKVAACTPPIGALVASSVPGLPVLDGSRPECEWDTDPDAPAPGIFGPSHLPALERRDWVSNMNDSYWLTNPAEPLTGYARVIGDEGTARSLRTRLGILQVQRRLDGSDGRPGNRFDLATLQEIVLDAHVYSGELARSEVLAELCPRADELDVAAACAALERWDTAASLDSVGLPVWQEFWRKVAQVPAWYEVPFDASDPVNTPRGLDTDLAGVQQALRDAQSAVWGSGFDLQAPLRDVQHSGVNDATIPIFGAEGGVGAFTIAISPGLTADGYRVDYGNSYIQTVTWDEAGVRAEGFLTYSQSTDPASPHFADFTRAYAEKAWHRLPFHRDEVEAAMESRVVLSDGTP